MKVVNIMNFVRQCGFKRANSVQTNFETAAAEEALLQEFGLEHTVLLQYDALIDPAYQKLFPDDDNGKREIGLWYEIVKPLTDKVGLPWRGEEGTTWDWHIIPGFSMAYTPEERKVLISTAMEDFKEIYGYYPRTVASWLMDSVTVAYLAEYYHVAMIAICRDQTNTDAYTLVGGYFNQGYYPSRQNVFCTAQTAEQQINVPVFRLLGPDPIHNYDNKRYITEPEYQAYHGCYTLEPIWPTGSNPDIAKWFFDNYFRNEDLGFSYAQLGQENGFGPDLLPGLRMQLELLKQYPEVQVMKMGDTGEWFRQNYSHNTPATAVSALCDWNGSDEVQSIYYDCKNYVANLFRFRNRIFFRGLYLFDEHFKEAYLDRPCETWDALYENLPIVDTLIWKGNKGFSIDDDARIMSLKKDGEGCLSVTWGEKEVLFTEEKITIKTKDALFLDKTSNLAHMNCQDNAIAYLYKGYRYGLKATVGRITEAETGYQFMPEGGQIEFKLERIGMKEAYVYHKERDIE